MENLSEFSASILSKLTFSWINPLLNFGFKGQQMEGDDMQYISEDLRSEIIVKKYENIHRNMIRDNLKVSISVMQLLMRTFWKDMVFIASLELCTCLLAFANPIILDNLISFMSNNEPFWHGFIYVLLMFMADLLWSVIDRHTEINADRMGIQMESCIMNSVYKKSLKLSCHEREYFPSGQVFNLIAVDAEQIINFLVFATTFWSVPLQLIIGFYFLWIQLGVSALSGLLVMLFLVPVNSFLANQLKKINAKILNYKDTRINLLNEILNGIKLIKLNAWEIGFINQVNDVRKREMKFLKSRSYVNGLSSFICEASAFLVAIASFSTYIISDPKNTLTANKAFVSLSLLHIIQYPLEFVPQFISYSTSYVVSLKRVNEYLNATEIDDSAIIHCDDPNKSAMITIDCATFSWSKEEDPLLNDLSFEVRDHSLIAIVGKVGSGKSSLFEAINGNMFKHCGSVTINGSIAFVPQFAFIQNETLRNNILFINDMNEKRYSKVLESCALMPDLNVLPDGDMTEIGENGINLSGGQKQRVSLARAVYSDADIYLLDDPLSAVDSHVMKHLFENVIGPNGMLKNKIRLLITHRISVLPKVDRIIVMDNGTIIESGTYNELLQSESKFSEFLKYDLLRQSKQSIDLTEIKELEEIAAKISPKLARQISEHSMGKYESSDYSDDENFHDDYDEDEEDDDDDDDDKLISKKSTLIENEHIEIGPIKWSLFYSFLKDCGIIGSLSTMIFYGISSAFDLSSNLYLSYWTDSLDENDTQYNSDHQFKLLYTYVFLGFEQILFLLFGSILLSVLCVNGAKALHTKMLWAVMRAPMSFFDTTLMGNTINRFADDMDDVDTKLDINLRMTLIQIFKAFVVFIIIILETPLAFPIIVISSVAFSFIYNYYISSLRRLSRLESTLQTPIFSQFSETITGVSSIRAYNANNYFIKELNSRIDRFHNIYFLRNLTFHWFTLRLEFLGYTSVLFVGILAVYCRGTLTPGTVGLLISYAMTINAIFNALVDAFTDLETNLVSVERCDHYSRITPEAPWTCRFDVKKDWPSNGNIKLNKLSLRYRKELDLVIDNVSINIFSGEKIGIIGRTGAGKSSFALSLFRLMEPVSGSIIIDGIDILKLGLHELRSKLTIIPQDIIIFSGTLRTNLDPLMEYSDTEIWTVINLAHLFPFVNSVSNGLNHKILENGENLSAGQRQLLCLARALLKRSKILVIDEGTASCDIETDKLVQNTIKTQFKDCTVITIAHRVNTVSDCDRILVIDDGKISKICTPNELSHNVF